MPIYGAIIMHDLYNYPNKSIANLSRLLNMVLVFRKRIPKEAVRGPLYWPMTLPADDHQRGNGDSRRLSEQHAPSYQQHQAPSYQQDRQAAGVDLGKLKQLLEETQRHLHEEKKWVWAVLSCRAVLLFSSPLGISTAAIDRCITLYDVYVHEKIKIRLGNIDIA